MILFKKKLIRYRLMILRATLNISQMSQNYFEKNGIIQVT